MRELHKYINIKNIFYVYSILLFGLMPMIITPWRGEVYYNGKIIFSFFITLLFVICYLYKNIINLTYINQTIFKPDIFKFLLFYAFLLSVSTYFSINRKISLFGQYKSREGLVVLILYLVVFYMFYKNFHFSFKVFEIILICATIISILGILQFLRILPNFNIYTPNSWEKGSLLSTIGNRNFAGTFCSLFLPMSIGFWVYLQKYRGIFYIGSIFGFLLASQTRGAWLAFLTYIFLFFLINIKNTTILKKWCVLIILMIIIFLALNLISSSQIGSRLHLLFLDLLNMTNDSAGSNRVYYWKITINHILDHPFFGYGIDTFGEFYRQNYGFLKIYFEKIHNEYMQLAFTAGFPALFMYLILVFNILFKLLKKSTKSFLAQILFFCLISYLIQAFFNLSMLPNAILFWALLGIGLNICKNNDLINDQPKHSSPAD